MIMYCYCLVTRKKVQINSLFVLIHVLPCGQMEWLQCTPRLNNAFGNFKQMVEHERLQVIAEKTV